MKNNKMMLLNKSTQMKNFDFSSRTTWEKNQKNVPDLRNLKKMLKIICELILKRKCSSLCGTTSRRRHALQKYDGKSRRQYDYTSQKINSINYLIKEEMTKVLLQMQCHKHHNSKLP